MNIQVREFLINLSREKVNQTITYQKLSDKCNLGLNMQNNPSDRVEIGNILEEISKYEHENKRPLLSVLVVRTTDGDEGDGFYKLAEKLGYGKYRTLKSQMFSSSQITECINYWSDKDNYRNHFKVV